MAWFDPPHPETKNVGKKICLPEIFIQKNGLIFILQHPQDGIACFSHAYTYTYTHMYMYTYTHMRTKAVLFERIILAFILANTPKNMLFC